MCPSWGWQEGKPGPSTWQPMLQTCSPGPGPLPLWLISPHPPSPVTPTWPCYPWVLPLRKLCWPWTACSRVAVLEATLGSIASDLQWSKRPLYVSVPPTILSQALSTLYDWQNMQGGLLVWVQSSSPPQIWSQEQCHWKQACEEAWLWLVQAR